MRLYKLEWQAKINEHFFEKVNLVTQEKFGFQNFRFEKRELYLKNQQQKMNRNNKVNVQQPPGVSTISYAPQGMPGQSKAELFWIELILLLIV